MKRKAILNLPDDFILTSELLNVSLGKTLETIIKNLKIYDFISRDANAKRSGGKEIFKRFLRTKGVDDERIIKEMSHANDYISCIQSLVKVESGVKYLEYRAAVMYFGARR